MFWFTKPQRTVASNIRQLGQYEDEELEGLYYNRFRYYDCNIGGYISQDPIGLAGNNPNFYAYVEDSNSWVDVFGLDMDGCGNKKVLKRDMVNGPHASNRSLQQVKDRAISTNKPQGRWNSKEAAQKAANKNNGTTHAVEIDPADGVVVKHLGNNEFEIINTDRAITIPKGDAIHTYPIAPDHPDYNTLPLD